VTDPESGRTFRHRAVQKNSVATGKGIGTVIAPALYAGMFRDGSERQEHSSPSGRPFIIEKEQIMNDMTIWQIDPAHTAIEFAVKHMMFTTVRGRFKTFTGSVHVNERHPDQSRVEVTIDVASIDTGVADRDVHLRSADFFDADNHPQIIFRTTHVDGAHKKEGDRFKVGGELEIRGKRVPVTLDATFEGLGTDPSGKHRAGFAARTEIDRREWGLRWNQALETGGVLVANNVKIEIEAQAVKQESDETVSAAAGSESRRSGA
jgi:polyisoprenoid-binding protein YceI